MKPPPDIHWMVVELWVRIFFAGTQPSQSVLSVLELIDLGRLSLAAALIVLDIGNFSTNLVPNSDCCCGAS